MSAAEQIVDKLGAAGRSPRGAGAASWTARCPTHEDNNPSLSVRQIEGRALVHCHAGCATEDVLSALGLTMADAFDSPKGAEYQYGDGRTVHRSPLKRFRQSGNTKGNQLYRLDRIKAAVAAGKPVFVVEGEQDVHAVESLGAVATCSPMGAGKAHKADWSPLASAKVLIIADRDEPGERHARDVLRILCELRADAAVFRAATGKDAADHIAAGHGLGEFVVLDVAVPAEGKEQQRPRVEPLNWSTFMTADFGDVDWLPGKLMVRGQQISLVGEGKAGKSLFAQEWSWRMAAGKAFLGDCARAPLRVLYIDHENPHEDIQARMRSFGAGAESLGNLMYLSFPPFRPLDTLEGALDLLGAVEEYRAEVVVFDTISRMIRGKENDSDTWLAVYRHSMLPLKARRVCGIRLDHFGKDADRGARGSSAKTQDIDHVWELTARTDSALRLRRTHTRTGIGLGDLSLLREGEVIGDQWKEGATRHVLAAHEDGTPIWTGEGVRKIAKQLDEAGVSSNLGRTKTREACTRLGIRASNELLADVVEHRKLTSRTRNAESQKLSGTGQVLSFPKTDREGGDSS